MKATQAQLDTVRLVATAMMKGDSARAEALIRTLPAPLLKEVRAVVLEMMSEHQ